MRKSMILLCSLAFGLSGCAPATHDADARSREQRPYPDATLGTENAESQWYRTQTIAPPSPAGAAGSATGGSAADAPARLSKTPVPVRAAKPLATPAGTVPVANPAQ
jgi:hypothetical protein